MATQLQIRRGTSAQVAAFTGAEGEVVVNTTNDSIHVNDGSTAGGFEMARVDGSNWAITNNISTTANISFGDNDKAVFGAGSDLQIYHNGSNSFIEEAGTGSLYVRANTDFRVQSYSDNEEMIRATANGAVTLYNNNSAKLATTSTGIDVTGVITTDGMTTSADINFGDNDKAIFGAGSDLQIYHDGSNSYISDVGTGSLIIDGSSSTQIKGSSFVILRSSAGENMAVGNADGSFDLYHNGAKKLATTSTGIDVTGSVVGDGLTVDGAGVFSAASPNIRLDETDTTDLNTRFRAQGGVLKLETTTDSAAVVATRMEIDHSTGNVSIPSGNLDVTGSVTADGLTVDGIATISSTIADMLTLEANSAAASPNIVFKNNDGEKARINSVDAGELYFGTGASGTEALRIDSSGNLIVGKTATAVSSDGVEARNNGLLVATRDSNKAAIFNRRTSDGDILEFNKDSAAVGSIGVNSDRIYLSGASEGVYIDTSLSAFSPCTTSGGNFDDHVDLGGSSSRFKDLYLSGDVKLANNSQITFASTSCNIEGNSSGADFIKFTTANSEAARFDSSGNLLVGTTGVPDGTSVYGAGFINTGSNGLVQLRLSASTTASLSIARFYNPNGNVGSIQLSGSVTSYVTSSDQRLKENIADADDAGSKVDAIQVRKFDWIADGSHQDYGMVAQELVTVAPEAVSQPQDPDDMMGVDYSKLVPMLVKEIQSLRARVAQLEN